MADFRAFCCGALIGVLTVLATTNPGDVGSIEFFLSFMAFMGGCVFVTIKGLLGFVMGEQ